MGKFFLLVFSIALLVFASGCLQQPSGADRAGFPQRGFDRNFSRPCSTDADCNFSNFPRGSMPFDANAFRANRCGNDANCLQRMQQDRNFSRPGVPQGDRNFSRNGVPPVFKCVSGICQMADA